MRIQIAERLRPFSHLPGTFFMLPGSALRLQIFPALIRVHDLSGNVPKQLGEIAIDVEGPVCDFTVEQDLEKSIIRVWGHTAKGYMRFVLMAIPGKPHHIGFKIEKQPEKSISFKSSQSGFLLEETNQSATPQMEQLSLGNHKAQNWQAINARCDLTEIFPIWMRLGQLTTVQPRIKSDKDSLFNVCKKAAEGNKKSEIISVFSSLYLAGFDFGFSPRLHDEGHHGYPLPVIDSKESPLSLLTEGAELIRSLFIRSSQGKIEVLPCLPPDFHCGRIAHISCGTSGNCAIEWSKKLIRRMVFTAAEDGELQFVFQREVNRFRLRMSVKDIGKVIAWGTPVEVAKGQCYLFDHFE